MRRVAEQRDHRPMAGNPKAMEASIDTEGRTLEESERELVEAVRRLGV